MLLFRLHRGKSGLLLLLLLLQVAHSAAADAPPSSRIRSPRSKSFGVARPGQPWMSTNTLSQDQIDAILDLHNKYRAEVNASNMFVLNWDPRLAELAQGHVDKCNTDNHTNLKLPSGAAVGQNMHMTSSKQGTVERAVNGWYSEKPYFNSDNFVCKKNRVCGHYQQIINAKTQYVGCALKTDCSPGSPGNKGPWKSFTVCNYFPYTTMPMYESGTACAKCLAANCTNGLCDCGDGTCHNGGKMDPVTCKCECWGPYNGAACCDKNCTQGDPDLCDYYFRDYGQGMCDFSNVPPKCPVKCGICNKGEMGKVLQGCEHNGAVELLENTRATKNGTIEATNNATKNTTNATNAKNATNNATKNGEDLQKQEAGTGNEEPEGPGNGGKGTEKEFLLFFCSVIFFILFLFSDDQ